MSASRVGRFEQSFVFHMIRDFFLLLIAVTGIELGVRYAVVRYEFAHHDREAVVQQAQRLAGDVKAIMLNSGGPVAARTVYPIVKRNFEELGLSIGIAPAPVTVSSMQTMFKITPQGIPAQWPAGEHNEARVSLNADPFCLNCHIHARLGEVLGEVTVRSYLASKLDAWWHEVRLSALIWAINIITHTIVLFLLLKIRMEPLLVLRATVARLAKGVIDLSHRARVNSHDEFGELGLDLNHFLDRINEIVDDLNKMLSKMVGASHRLVQVSAQMNSQFEALNASAQAVLHAALRTADAAPTDAAGTPGEQRIVLLQQLSKDVHKFAHYLSEMAFIEEKMRTVAESGQDLLRRLTRTTTDVAGQAEKQP